jgi:hypothetical protein
MRVSVLGGDVEGERAGIFNDLITQFNENACALLIGLFQEDGVEGRVELLADVL